MGASPLQVAKRALLATMRAVAMAFGKVVRRKCKTSNCPCRMCPAQFAGEGGWIDQPVPGDGIFGIALGETSQMLNIY